MSKKLKKYFGNGGIKDMCYIITVLIILGKILIASGMYREKFAKVEESIKRMDIVCRDISSIKTNQARILEILQGKYKIK